MGGLMDQPKKQAFPHVHTPPLHTLKVAQQGAVPMARALGVDNTLSWMIAEARCI